MTGLRERTRRAVRAELAAVAIRLFAEQGFDETTVDQIAVAAGLTKRSFFRYFPTKEDAVFGDVDLLGEQVVAEIQQEPGTDPWHCLHQVLRRWQQHIHASEQAQTRLRLIEATPSLRARLHEKRTAWRQHVADALRDRPGRPLDAFTADLLTNAAAAALDTVTQEWVRSGGTADRDALLDKAFALLRPDLRA